MATVIVKASDLQRVDGRLPGDWTVCSVEVKDFPNGETIVYIDPDQVSTADPPYILLWWAYPSVQDNVFRLLEVLDVLDVYCGDGDVVLVLPYLPYSRQDKRFREGEPLTLRLFLETVCSRGVDRIISFDVHNPVAFMRYSPVYAVSISLLPSLVENIVRSMGDDKLVLVAPDRGRAPLVDSLSSLFGVDYLVVEKMRDRVTGEVSFNFETVGGEISSYDVAVIVDDEISTGGTVAGVSSFLKTRGVKMVYAVATHLFLVGGAEERLSSSGVDLVMGSDTVRYDEHVAISIVDLLPGIAGSM